MSEWRDIETDKPRHGQLVLLYFPADGRQHLRDWYDVRPYPPHYPRRPTHWQSVEPPRG